jgi:hypothetical protein
MRRQRHRPRMPASRSEFVSMSDRRAHAQLGGPVLVFSLAERESEVRQLVLLVVRCPDPQSLPRLDDGSVRRSSMARAALPTPGRLILVNGQSAGSGRMERRREQSTGPAERSFGRTVPRGSRVSGALATRFSLWI